MLKALKRFARRVLWLTVGLAIVFSAWLFGYGWIETSVPTPMQFTLKQGSSLRSAARQMQDAHVIASRWQFEVLGRLSGHATRVQAGNYEVRGDVSPLKLLQMITSGVRGQDQLTIVDGWTLLQLRAALNAHPALKHETAALSDADLAAKMSISQASPEGWFLPDTYFFPNGASDAALLLRAHRAMRNQLDTLWKTRAEGLPLANPYEALILASIIEKETGQSGERSMIAAVFVNRLKIG